MSSQGEQHIVQPVDDEELQQQQQQQHDEEGQQDDEEELSESELLERQLAELDAEAEAAGVTTSSSTHGHSTYDPQVQAAVDQRSVHIGNVDYAVTEQDLRDFFSACGTINRVTIPTGPGPYGKPKGYAYMEFGSAEEAAAAMLLTDRELKGRVISVTSKRTNTAGVTRGRGRGGARGGPAIRGRGPPRGPPMGYPPVAYGYPPPTPYGYYPPPYGYPPPPRGGMAPRGRGGAAPRGGRGGSRQ